MTTYSALYYHLIWSTKNRELSILETIENKLYAYISGIIKERKGKLIQIGGMPDHIHILVRVTPDQNISDLVKTIKIASGKWLRETDPLLSHFFWQAGFGAFSVSKSQADNVKRYILNQKEHHRVHGFKEEWLSFLENHGIEYNQEYVFG